MAGPLCQLDQDINWIKTKTVYPFSQIWKFMVHRVNFTKSLGVLIDENLTWSSHINGKKFPLALDLLNELAAVFHLQPCIISITG